MPKKKAKKPAKKRVVAKKPVAVGMREPTVSELDAIIAKLKTLRALQKEHFRPKHTLTVEEVRKRLVTQLLPEDIGSPCSESIAPETLLHMALGIAETETQPSSDGSHYPSEVERENELHPYRLKLRSLPTKDLEYLSTTAVPQLIDDNMYTVRGFLLLVEIAAMWPQRKDRAAKWNQSLDGQESGHKELIKSVNEYKKAKARSESVQPRPILYWPENIQDMILGLLKLIEPIWPFLEKEHICLTQDRLVSYIVGPGFEKSEHVVEALEEVKTSLEHCGGESTDTSSAPGPPREAPPEGTGNRQAHISSEGPLRQEDIWEDVADNMKTAIEDWLAYAKEERKKKKRPMIGKYCRQEGLDKETFQSELDKVNKRKKRASKKK